MRSQFLFPTQLIGFTESEVTAAYRVLAGILLLGNVEFRYEGNNLDEITR